MKKMKKILSLVLAVMLLMSVLFSNTKALTFGEYEYSVLSDSSVEITNYIGTRKNIIIPDKIDNKTVTSIASYAFSNKNFIESIIFPDSITKLGKNIFADCKNLTSITIPKNLKVCLYDHSVSSHTNSFGAIIYNHYYYGPFANSSITTVIFPDGLYHIPEYIFYGCKTIEKIVLPTTISTIGQYAFYSTNKLSDVYYMGNQDSFAKIQINSNNSYLLNAVWDIEHKHTYSSLTICSPTCTDNGQIDYVCNCSSTYTEYPQAIGHNYIEIDSLCVTPSCTNSGRLYAQCSRCNDIKDEEIEALGHSEIILPSLDATCTTSGYTDGIKCKKCEEIIKPQETINPLGHKYSQVTIEPTCTEAGKAYQICNNCNYVTSEKILPEKGHSYQSEWQTITPATCQTFGIDIKICIYCFNLLKRQIPKIEHNHIETIKLPTCTESGIKTFTCECGDTYTETIDATGHKDENGDYKCDYGCGYAFEKPAPDTPSTPDEPENKPCSCNCHKGGISGFFFKIINFFEKLFGKNKVCACGAKH